MDALPASSPVYLTYLSVFGAAAVTCLVGARQARRRVALPDVRRGLVGLLVASGLWALSHVGVLLSSNPRLGTAFYEVGLVVGFGTVWAWLWFCSAYSGRSLHRNSAAWGAALTVLAVVVLTKLTNPWHGLYFSVEQATVPFPHFGVDHRVLYWITASLSYTMAAVGFFMLVEPLRKIAVGGWRLAGLFGLTALPVGVNAVGYAGPYLLDLSHEPIGVAAFSIGVLSLQGGWFEQAARAAQAEEPALVLSENDRIQNFNDQAAELFPSLRRPGTIGTSLGAALPGVNEALDPVEAVGAGGAVCEIENGGEARYFRPVESSFRWGGRRLIILADVTERELRRRKREPRLNALFEGSPDMIDVHDAAGNLLGANPRFFEATGYREEDLEDLKVWDLDASLGPQEATGLWSEMEAEERRRIEGTYRRKDGSTFPVEVHIRRLDLEEERFVAITRDITDRKRAEQKLEEERNRLRTLLKSLPTPVVQCQFDGTETTIIDANPAFSDTFGLSREEARGENPNELLVSPGQKEAAAEIDQIALSNGSAETEVQRIAQDGLRDFQLQAGGRKLKEGPAEIYAIYTDITEQKRREKRLRQSEVFFQNTQDALFVVDVTGAEERETASFAVERVNPAYEKKTGLEGEDLRGRSPEEILGEEAGREVAERYRKCARRQEPIEYEETLPIGGETTHWQTRIAPVIADGKVEQIVGTTRDVTAHKRRVRDLERHERLVENLPVGVFRTTASGELVDSNPALANLYDSTEGELHEVGAEAIYDNSEDRKALLETLRNEEKVERKLLQVRTLEGEERQVRTTITLTEEEGEHYLDGIAEDVTDRRRRKEELERKNDLFERAQEIADVGAWEYDVQSEALTMTDHARRVHGLPPDEDVSLDQSYRYYDSEDRFVAKEAMRRVIEEAEPYDLNFRLTTRSGEKRWIRCRGEPQLEAGEVVRVRGTIQNITEQRRQEEALREAQGRYRALIENFPGGVFLFDEALRYTLAGGQELRDVGLSPSAVEGKRPCDVFPKPVGTELEEYFRRALEGETNTFEQEMDGRRYRNRALPVRDETGAVIAGMAVGQDITKRKKQEEALWEAKAEAEEARREAEKANHLKSVFLANISHEIRTPLTSIIGFAELVGGEATALDLPEASPLPGYADTIEQSGKRLLETLEGVLNLSKLQAGQMELEAESVNLAEQARWAVEEARARAEEKEIGLQLETAPAVAEADEGGVQIVLQNLVSNAIKYTEGGGRVQVRSFREEGSAVLEVEDSGIGMDPALAESFFEPFRQASEGMGREYEGTGVGLAITNEAITQMDGSIEVDTEEDEGTRITVRLPVRGEESPADGGAPEPGP